MSPAPYSLVMGHSSSNTAAVFEPMSGIGPWGLEKFLLSWKHLEITHMGAEAMGVLRVLGLQGSAPTKAEGGTARMLLSLRTQLPGVSWDHNPGFRDPCLKGARSVVRQAEPCLSSRGRGGLGDCPLRNRVPRTSTLASPRVVRGEGHH